MSDDPKVDPKAAGERAPDQVNVVDITKHDRVTSFLMSLIVTAGLLTVAVGAVWACNQTWFVKTAVAEIEIVEIIEDVEGGGAEDGVLDSSLEAPGPESLTEEPSEEFDPEDIVADFPEMEQTISSVLSAVTTAVTMQDQLLTSKPGESSIQVGSRGTGRFRNVGKGPGDGGGVKRQERWEIRFGRDQTLDEYARQLDYFKVELGGITGGKLYLASKLATRRPELKVTGGGPGEKRLYFSWRGGGRRQTDLELLKRAGVPMSSAVVVLQFYPFETEQFLARIERDYARAQGKNDMRLVRKTRFEVIKDGDGYNFKIIKQEYFGDPPST